MKRKRNVIPESEDDSGFINNSDYDDQNIETSLLKENNTTRELDPKQEEVKSPNVAVEAPPQDESSLIDTKTDKQENSDPDSEASLGIPSSVNVSTKDIEAKDLNMKAYSSPLSLSAHDSVSQDQKPSVPQNEPRLVIDKLVLTNFKSYAGTQIIGPFHTSFSAVVGPNGSGKSNVIDSMLFVFGFRASKMRQGKLSELIHNSGGQRPDFCQVDIHFQTVLDDPVVPQKVEILPDSELIISRKAFRNNQSSYYINGKTSNYTEVTTLLKDKGIDLDHKRFLILQGEVESIAQMKAKAEKENDDGLLEYLEDIIGTTKYKKLIEDSMIRVDELNEICLEKANRFDLVEKDKDQMEEKKTEALRFLELEKKLINSKSIQFQINIHECQKQISKKQSEIDDLNKQLEENRESNKEILEGIETELTHQKEMEKTIKTLSAEIDVLGKQKKESNKKNVSLEEKFKNVSNKLKKIQKSLETSKSTVSSSKQKLSNYTESTEKFKNEIDELNKQLEIEEAKLDEIRSSLTDKTSEFTKEIQEYQKKLDPWNTKLNEQENAIKLAESAIDILRNQMNSTTKQLEEHKERLLEIKKSGKEKEVEYRESISKLEQIDEQIALGEEQCAASKETLEKFKSQLINHRQKTQESSNILQNSQNKNKVLTSLLRMANSGRIDGFYGRLGDLGTIDEKYDVAISTAAPGLDSMVVETVETAQACIEYLRKNKLGYANFICLNKLRTFNLAPIQTPGDPSHIKRLFDLIQPSSPKFAPAFYSKMYNTLVAPNLNEAKKVAYGAKRWKVVTLDGKVVDTSGTMSGGGNYVSKGAMRLSNSSNNADQLVTEQDLEKLKNKLSKMETEFEQMSSDYNQKITMLDKLKKLKPDTEFEISRLKLDIDSLVAEKKEVSQICKNLISEQQKLEENNPFEEQLSQKECELEQLKTSKNETKSQMSGFEQQISVLEQKIMDAGGVELKVQSSKTDSIRQKISIIHDKTSSDRMTVKKLENEINRHSKLIDTLTAEQQEAEPELESIRESQRAISTKLQELNEKIEKMESEKVEHEDELEKLKTVLEEKQEQINVFKSVEIEITNKLEKCTSELNKLNSTVNHNQEDLDALVVRDVEPYISWLEKDEQEKYNGALIEKLSEEEIRDIDLDVVNSEIEELENYMANVKVDIEILKEYGVKISEYNERKTDLNSAVEERDNKKNYCDDLKRKRLDEFMVGFNTISMTLKDMYRMITMGGNAELELVDSLDPFSEGILFSVMPPKKSWKNISNLSGGEKTLSSLALVFALHKYKPTPLYVMDEIDAALDFRNVSIVANYIKERTKNAQFVVISLRNNMFELAQQLVGIYKVNNMTKSVSLANLEIQKFR
ncbi:SMC4 Structural maintenance of chromosomes protein 4 [Candida maltosa Xu316]|uniref:Structural maintenance of chromosomes protein n=1 Tax=Candida maltosa (strain Xu316) TaxID=1245528 RepID=M3HGA4_CANMX|nr:putative nuclear condensin complex SMC ATPase [Candida maltosa Xu316]